MDFDLLAASRFDAALLEADWNTLVNAGVPSPYLLLQFILDRFIDAAKQHDRSIPADLSLHNLHYLCDQAVQQNQHPQKIRILISKSGQIKVETSSVPHIPYSLISAATTDPSIDNLGKFEPIVPIYLDSEPTPSSVFTSTKTTNRHQYEAARVRHGIPPLGTRPAAGQKLPDVLIYNLDNQLTETSIRNIALFRGGHWVTPPLTTGCLSGIVRRLLLDRDLILEGVLHKDDVKLGEVVLLFNGVEGCSLGRVTKCV